MTEEEAKTKWCPHVRHMTWPSDSGASGGNQPVGSSLCIASDCMMWRWEYEIICTDNVMEVAGKCYRKKTNNGRCGLAQ